MLCLIGKQRKPDVDSHLISSCLLLFSNHKWAISICL